MNGYMTIPQTAKQGLMPEYRLRMRLKAGKLPGIWNGKKFMVNVVALEKMLDDESLSNIIDDSEE